MRKKQRRTPRNKTSRDLRPVVEALAVGLAPASQRSQERLARKLARQFFSKGSKVQLLGRHPARKNLARDVLLLLPKNTTLNAAQAWELARALEKDPAVRYAEPLFDGPGLEPSPRAAKRLLAPHERGAAARTPRSKSSGDGAPLPCAAQNVLWSLDQIRAVQAWTLLPPAGGRQFGEGVVVGHPDTGYQPHDEIWSQTPSQRRIRPQDGYDFEEGDSDPLDPLTGQAPGHGTATASVIMSGRAVAGETTLVGTAPAAELVPIRVSDSVVHFSFKNVTKAIYHAVDRAGAQVISMSLGGPFPSSALKNAVDYAVSRGVVVLAAAGNVWPWVVYPARLDAVVAVAASNCNAVPWSKSASGSDVDITAPGESVWRAKSEKKTGTVQFSIEPSSGTSYAVANVAGACATWLAFHGRAALISRYGAANLARVFMSLLKSQGFWTPANWKVKKYGPGIVDMARLLAAQLPPQNKVRRSIPAKAVSRPAAILDDITSYFPDLPPARVRAVIKRSFMPKASMRARQRGLYDLGPELAFQVAANAAVRSRIYLAARGSAKAKLPARNPLQPMKKDASPALKQAVS
jgi:thermitase